MSELPPQEVLARIHAMLIPLKAQRRKLTRMMYVCLGGGLALTALFTLTWYLAQREVSFWGVPALLLGALFAYFYKRLRETTDVQIKALEMAEEVTRQKGAARE